VKLDVDTLSIVPAAPPAAGPDRALDPPLRAVGAAGEVAVVVVPELLAVALTMPYAPPPIAMAVTPMARALESFRENMS
jgi:hypothetical protein